MAAPAHLNAVPPVYVADASGVRYRVYDRVPDPAVAYYQSRAVAPGASGATQRLFVREGDTWWFGVTFGRGPGSAAHGAHVPKDPADLAPATLARQLAVALGDRPWRRRDEGMPACLARCDAHAAARAAVATEPST